MTAFSSLASGRAGKMPGKRQGHGASTPQVENHLDCWGGRTSQSEAPQDGLQSLSDGTVNIRTGWADVGGRTVENDIGKLGREGSLQIRVAHFVQQHQRLLEFGNPALEYLFTEGGRANRAAKEREPLTGDRDLRWQWGERRNTTLAGQRGGLASVEVEEQRGRPSPRCGVQQRGPTRKPN